MKQINITGVIGWDAMPETLREDLREANGGPVEIVVSSPGGFVGAGIEMFNLIRNYSGQTVARLSSYAMSMGSYIPLAADRIVAEDNAVYMIHNARGGVIGDHNDIIKYGQTTKALSNILARAYVRRTGKSLEEIQAMMDEETYFFGQDMVDAGFVDEIIETGEDNDQLSATALAQVAFEDCISRMTADQDAMRKDLTRAAALAGSVTDKRQPRAQATAEPANTGEVIMDLKKLKSDHPDLVAAIVAEAVEGMITEEALQQQLTVATTAGAETERQRIAKVREQLIPGHEELVEQMAFDGQSTAADVALAIVAKEKTLRTSAAAELDNEAPPVVPSVNVDDDSGKKLKRTAFNALDQTARSAFLAAGGKIVD